MPEMNGNQKKRGRTVEHKASVRLDAPSTQLQPFTLKKVINLKNRKKGNIVEIPALDIVQLGHNNRVFGNHHVKGAGGKLPVSEIDQFNFLSSSSEDSKAKAKVKDIVFDPRQRKRLLDSLNIVTTRDKW